MGLGCPAYYDPLVTIELWNCYDIYRIFEPFETD